ncbi:MAG: VPLPA-CTERM sorting domain-containing protein [Geminicoccaceae bacterium]
MRRLLGLLSYSVVLGLGLVPLYMSPVAAALFNVSGTQTIDTSTIKVSGSVDIDTSTAAGTPSNSTVIFTVTGPVSGTGFMSAASSQSAGSGQFYLRFVGVAPGIFSRLETPNPSSGISFANFTGGTFASVLVIPGRDLSFSLDITFSAVPIPAALPLLASGLVGIGYLRRRQHKAA